MSNIPILGGTPARGYEVEEVAKVWKLTFTYMNGRVLSADERDKLGEELEMEHPPAVEWNGAKRNLRIWFHIEDIEPMHLILGAWLLDVKKIMATEFGFPPNNMVEATIARYLSPTEEKELRKLWSNRAKAKK